MYSKLLYVALLPLLRAVASGTSREIPSSTAF